MIVTIFFILMIGKWNYKSHGAKAFAIILFTTMISLYSQLIKFKDAVKTKGYKKMYFARKIMRFKVFFPYRNSQLRFFIFIFILILYLYLYLYFLPICVYN